MDPDWGANSGTTIRDSIQGPQLGTRSNQGPQFETKIAFAKKDSQETKIRDHNKGVQLGTQFRNHNFGTPFRDPKGAQLGMQSGTKNHGPQKLTTKGP